MRIEDAAPKPGSKRRRRRIGRGIAAGQGASGGFGMRGQKSRSGRPTRPGFEGGQMPLYRRIPKLKSFPLVNRTRYTIVNLKSLADLPANSQVSLASLLEAGILTTSKEGRLKILADGELSVALHITADAFTAQARTKIEAVGGTCVLTSEVSEVAEASDSSEPSAVV